MSRFVTFEMDQLYSLDQRIMNGALFYIFERIRRRLSSDVPTFMFVDEFRAALSHALAAKALEDYLFEGRKLNLMVWLVVQELSRTLASPLKGAVLEQTMTKICLYRKEQTAYSLRRTEGGSLLSRRSRRRDWVSSDAPGRGWVWLKVMGRGRAGG
jgi:type IV secretory pathway VirB4 component